MYDSLSFDNVLPRQAFGSEERDEEMGYYQMGRRLYDPAIGRFMAVDPLFESFPTQSPYAYAFNSPLSWSDPSGLAPEKERKRDRVLSNQLKIISSEIANLDRMNYVASWQIYDLIRWANQGLLQFMNLSASLVSLGYAAAMALQENTYMNQKLNAQSRIAECVNAGRQTSSYDIIIANSDDFWDLQSKARDEKEGYEWIGVFYYNKISGKFINWNRKANIKEATPDDWDLLYADIKQDLGEDIADNGDWVLLGKAHTHPSNSYGPSGADFQFFSLGGGSGIWQFLITSVHIEAYLFNDPNSISKIMEKRQNFVDDDSFERDVYNSRRIYNGKRNLSEIKYASNFHKFMKEYFKLNGIFFSLFRMNSSSKIFVIYP